MCLHLQNGHWGYPLNQFYFLSPFLHFLKAEFDGWDFSLHEDVGDMITTSLPAVVLPFLRSFLVLMVFLPSVFTWGRWNFRWFWRFRVAVAAVSRTTRNSFSLPRFVFWVLHFAGFRSCVWSTKMTWVRAPKQCEYFKGEHCPKLHFRHWPSVTGLGDAKVGMERLLVRFSIWLLRNLRSCIRSSTCLSSAAMRSCLLSSMHWSLVMVSSTLGGRLSTCGAARGWQATWRALKHTASNNKFHKLKLLHCFFIFVYVWWSRYYKGIIKNFKTSINIYNYLEYSKKKDNCQSLKPKTTFYSVFR